MDARKRNQRLDEEIGDVALRLGTILGLLDASGADVTGLKGKVTELLDELRTVKEAGIDELLKATDGQHGHPMARRGPHTPAEASPAVQRVIDFVRKQDRPVTSKDVKLALGLDSHNARQGLFRALNTGQIERRGRGAYVPAGTASTQPS